jgi:type VI secretion system secreted protein Hcp
MVPTLVFPRARTLALLLAAAVVALLAFTAVASRSANSNAGAATAGVVSIEMKITGQKTGVFKGDSTQKGHEDEILVSGYQFELDSPRDAASGQATGKRQYKPIVVTKQLGASSPQLVQACATNENLNKVVIDFYKSDRTGKLVNFYRVTLTDASISSDKQYSAGNTVNEDIAFVFRKITQEDLVAKTSFTDDWQASIS